MISSVDIMPTILEAAGLAVPPGIEGRSLLPLLEGRSVPWRKTLCGEFNWHTRSIFRPQRSIRDDRYKLIVTLDAAGNDTVQFFDLRHDPHEFTNLAGQPHVRAQQQRLMQRLSEWRTATKDPLLDRREIVRQKDQYYQKS
jgi:arylsulfatase A-like enzyme